MDCGWCCCCLLLLLVARWVQCNIVSLMSKNKPADCVHRATRQKPRLPAQRSVFFFFVFFFLLLISTAHWLGLAWTRPEIWQECWVPMRTMAQGLRRAWQHSQYSKGCWCPVWRLSSRIPDRVAAAEAAAAFGQSLLQNNWQCLLTKEWTLAPGLLWDRPCVPESF